MTACPGCAAALTLVPRYPRRFCADCLAGAVDGGGRRLTFCNLAVSGGLGWMRGTDAPVPALAVLCLIRGRIAVVTEARFGGVVAEPLDGPATKGATDLTVAQPSA